MTRILALALASILTATAASAQPSLAIELTPAFERTDDSDTAEARPSVAGSIAAEQYLIEERVRLFYSLDTGTFATPGNWGYFEHTGGGRYRFDLGRGARHHLFAGGDVTIRRNGDSWDAANYAGLGAFANLELHPGDTAIVRTGYRIDRRSFPSATELDHVQHDTFASVVKSFRTRTTLIGEIHAGIKRYAGAPPAGTVPAEVVPTVESPTTVGRGQGSGSQSQQRVQLASISTAPGAAVSGDVARAGQVTLFARVAQSLADRTGLTVELQRRDVFGDVPAAVVTTPANFFDDGVYDDPFASEATVGRVGLKTILRGEIGIEGAGLWQDKLYPHTPALGADGSPLAGLDVRRDEIWRALAVVTVPMYAQNAGRLSVDLTARYDFTHHQSTDAYYRYTSHGVGVGAAVSY